MSKAKLNSVLLIAITTLTCFLVLFQPISVVFAGEEITNGGFETGDATGWTLTDGAIQSSEVNSGTYAAQIWPSGTRRLNQTLSTYAPVSVISTFTAYYNQSSSNGVCRTTYSDDTYTDQNLVTTDAWTQIDLLPGLTAGKTVKDVAFINGVVDHLYIDDVTLITNPLTGRTTSNPSTITSTFTVNGTSHTTPWVDGNMVPSNYTLVCVTTSYTVNSSLRYTFNYWSVNASTNYYSPTIFLYMGGNTNFTIYYQTSYIEQPFFPSFTADALNGTLYFRSDTHTVHEQLSYRLDWENTQTSTYTTRTTAGTHNVSYGIRVWVWTVGGENIELSGGTPEATVTMSTDDEGYEMAWFSCPGYGSVIDAIQVNLYQRFNSDPWSLRRYFLTSASFNTKLGRHIKLPASSWRLYYYMNRTTASTTSTFYHGSTSYNSRFTFQYYEANPWEVALTELVNRQYFNFLFTPWTYWLADLFWALVLLFGIVTGYVRHGSLKPVLALLWIVGGAGSILDALIPAVAIHVAWLMLALAMGITLFRLIYR